MLLCTLPEDFHVSLTEPRILVWHDVFYKATMTARLLVTSLIKSSFPLLLSLASHPVLGRVTVVPNFFHNNNNYRKSCALGNLWVNRHLDLCIDSNWLPQLHFLFFGTPCQQNIDKRLWVSKSHPIDCVQINLFFSKMMKRNARLMGNSLNTDLSVLLLIFLFNQPDIVSWSL